MRKVFSISFIIVCLFLTSLLQAQNESFQDQFKAKIAAKDCLGASELLDAYVSENQATFDKQQEINVANFYVETANCFFGNNGPFDKAAEYYTKAADIQERHGLLKNVSTLVNNAGTAFYKAGMYDDAIKSFLKSVDIDSSLGDKKAQFLKLKNIGNLYIGMGNHDSARVVLQKALELNPEEIDDRTLSTLQEQIGKLYTATGDYFKAITLFESLKEKYEAENELYKLCSALQNLGFIQIARGKFHEAKELLNQSMSIADSLKDALLYINNFELLGKTYKAEGNYDKALENFSSAQQVGEISNNPYAIGSNLINKADIYHIWGQEDKALKTAEEAIALFYELNDEQNLASAYNTIGLIYKAQKEYDKAIEMFTKALELNQKLGDRQGIAININNLGTVYQATEKYEQALGYFMKSLEIKQEFGSVYLAMDYNNIASIYFANQNYPKALEYLHDAETNARIVNDNAGLSNILNNIGTLYYIQKNFIDAAKYFKESIEIKEVIRKSAQGKAKLDYLENQIGTYEMLIAAELSAGKYEDAYTAIENSSAKYLAERIASGVETTIPSIAQIQSSIDEKTAILVYANTTWDNFVRLMITKTGISGTFISKDEYLAEYQSTIKDKKPKRSGGLRVVKKVSTEEKLVDFDLRNDLFVKSINSYRELLSKVDSAKIDEMKKMGNSLYGLLFYQLESELTGIENIILIPSGILGFLPFEALIDDSGKYLAERFAFTYTQSLSIRELIRNRNYDTANKKSLLAFGGAEYQNVKNEDRGSAYNEDSTMAEDFIYKAAEESGIARDLYLQLGLKDWGNLPGTLKEVEAIHEIVENAEIKTKNDASETTVKTLSEANELTEYNIIHFATHGLVVPAVPELSAVVLSQKQELSAFDDGYLRMPEITELNLEAEFVNLSACETGLGKIYGGEGVVGLTQAFLIAGANGLSVSLWQVADESTAEFMIGLYKHIVHDKMDYFNAISEMKKKFITGKTEKNWTHPFYWAPFVFYGK